jgi:hypothetical protein
LLRLSLYLLSMAYGPRGSVIQALSTSVSNHQRASELFYAGPYLVPWARRDVVEIARRGDLCDSMVGLWHMTSIVALIDMAATLKVTWLPAISASSRCFVHGRRTSQICQLERIAGCSMIGESRGKCPSSSAVARHRFSAIDTKCHRFPASGPANSCADEHEVKPATLGKERRRVADLNRSIG